MQSLEDKILHDAKIEVNSALTKAISDSLCGYNKPLSMAAEQVVHNHKDEFKSLMSSAVTGLLEDKAFKDELKGALRTKLAKLIIAQASGELESHLTKIKNDPTHKAQLTLAVSHAIKLAGGCDNVSL